MAAIEHRLVFDMEDIRSFIVTCGTCGTETTFKADAFKNRAVELYELCTNCNKPFLGRREAANLIQIISGYRRFIEKPTEEHQPPNSRVRLVLDEPR